LQARLNYCEPGITEREPAALDNLAEHEPKSPMIASPAVDNLKPLQLSMVSPKKRPQAESAQPSPSG
jgi:hypothetical protein